ncbi:MAG: SMC-Scp complex subunit ScpB [Acidobacteriota bacterium]|nr:SMC-Scp complex subunit ScpB [Acidobacteriota bacterium]
MGRKRKNSTDDETGAVAATGVAERDETTTGDSRAADSSRVSSELTDDSEESPEAFAAEVDETDAAGGSEEEDDLDAEIVIHDADAEDLAEQMAALQRERRERAQAGGPEDDGEIAPGGEPRGMAELMGIIEALVFVSEEPIPVKTLAEVLKEDRGWVEVAVQELAKEFNERNAGLMLREVAGGWQFATRPEHHEHVRAFLKSRPSAKLSLAALETLAVIAYKQPITVPEILEIRGVQSSSAIKTLLDKRLIVAKGRKEVVGRPMMYGTSKEFLMQFGLRDLSELPNIEDFEDLTGGGS